jgi:hypothetical protein
MIVPFLMLAGTAASSIDLACTTAPRGNVVRYRFSIEADANSFTGRFTAGGQDYPVSGVAAVSADSVLLTQRDEKITTLYRISRVTGDLQMEMGLNDQSPIQRVAGSCQKFTGNAF